MRQREAAIKQAGMHDRPRQTRLLRPWEYPEQEWADWEQSPVGHVDSKRNLKAFATNLYGSYDAFRLLLMSGRSLARSLAVFFRCD